MLDSLDIKNYRNLKKLSISSLGKVNLIIGKNNTGKSTLLEAIAVYATRGDLALIYQLLGDRGESFRQNDPNKNTTELNIRALSSLFTGRVVGFEESDAISIGSLGSTLIGDSLSSEKTISLRFVKYFDEIQKDNQGGITARKRILAQNALDQEFANLKEGIEIKEGKSSSIISFEEDRLFRNRTGFRSQGNNDSLQFIRTRNIDREINGKLFDKIILTEKEKFVIEALKIIEPSTERIAFVEESMGERSAVIKLSKSSAILPLQSMGDGINRILTIILALVNADNGYLLIDEFENGLHHSVQNQLWKIIFDLARKLNVQIFATTHSEDCITGFATVLNNPDNVTDGKLIRLENRNGTIRQVEYDANELRIATVNNIETR
ncbi:MAG: AAA family ATPase [Mariniphaga sp.]